MAVKYEVGAAISTFLVFVRNDVVYIAEYHRYFTREACVRGGMFVTAVRTNTVEQICQIIPGVRSTGSPAHVRSVVRRFCLGKEHNDSLFFPGFV